MCRASFLREGATAWAEPSLNSLPENVAASGDVMTLAFSLLSRAALRGCGIRCDPKT